MVNGLGGGGPVVMDDDEEEVAGWLLLLPVLDRGMGTMAIRLLGGAERLVDLHGVVVVVDDDGVVVDDGIIIAAVFGIGLAIGRVCLVE